MYTESWLARCVVRLQHPIGGDTMTLTFYTVTDDYRKLDKTLGTAVGTYTGELREIVGDLEMEIVLPGTAFNDLVACNYCYIDTFGKYYFREEYRIDNNCTIVKLKEDVRMNFATQIKATPATINRSASLYNGFLYDNGYQMLAYKKNAIRKFSVSLDDWDMILTTVG